MEYVQKKQETNNTGVSSGKGSNVRSSVYLKDKRLSTALQREAANSVTEFPKKISPANALELFGSRRYPLIENHESTVQMKGATGVIGFDDRKDTVQLNKKGKTWGGLLLGGTGALVGGVLGHGAAAMGAVAGGLSGLATGAVAGYKSHGVIGGLTGLVGGGIVGAASGYYTSAVHGAVAGAAIGHAVGSKIGDLATGPGYKLGMVAPDLKSMLDEALKTRRGKELAERSYEITKIPLSVMWVTSAEAPTGANYHQSANKIGISMANDPKTHRKEITESILWELENAEQNWSEVSLEYQLDRNKGKAQLPRNDRVSMVYHMEKSEYIGVVRQYKNALIDGHSSAYAANFVGGHAARWASFDGYLKDMVTSGHYANLFTDIPLTYADYADLLKPEDVQKHNWSTAEMPPVYKRPNELMELKID